MTAAVATWVALGVALAAARVTLRRRGVFLLGRHGHLIAPAALGTLWLAGLLLGQATRSLIGMVFVAALPLMALAIVSYRNFPRQASRHARFTRLDLLMVLHMGLVFWVVNLWDIECHRAIVGQFLHGNLPPTAINDPRAPLAYHATYDALVAVVLTALPLDLEQGMAVASIACLTLTIANLRCLTRLLFRSPVVGQLGRALFVYGFGPVLIRYFIEGFSLDGLHGGTSQSYVDIILRRPAGLGFALFTLALSLLLPFYRSIRAGGGTPPTTPLAQRQVLLRLLLLLPVCALLPQTAEETTLFLGVLIAPLVVARRLRWPWVALLGVALAVGLLQSGVVRGVLGQGSMATPHMRPSWPPTLPSWRFRDDGAVIWSGNGLAILSLEFGPVFLASLLMGLFGKDERRRVLMAVFLAGLVAALFIKAPGWPKSDLDRFLFYGTPSVFMLSAALVEWLQRRYPGLQDRPARLKALAVGFAVVMCGPPFVVPTHHAAGPLEGSFFRHAFGGDLKRNLKVVAPREPILTTTQRADELIQAGFMVVAPLDSNSIGRITEEHFDEYLRNHAADAAWLFLPENDARVKNQPVEGRDGSFVLVRAPMRQR